MSTSLYMHSFFNPSVRLVNKLSFTQKILLLFCIFIIIVVPLVYQTVYPLLQIRAYSKKEILGLEFIDKLYLLRKNIFLNINTITAQKNAEEKQQLLEEITENFNKIEEFVRTIEGQVDVRDQFMKVKAEWETAKNAFNTNITLKIGALINDTCDRVDIIIDPDIDTSFLVDTLCTKFNNYTEYAANLRNIGTEVLTNKVLTEQIRDNILFAKDKMNFYVVDIKEDMYTAMKANPSLEQTLKASANEFYYQTRHANDMLADILDKTFKLQPSYFFDEFTSLIIKSYDFREKIIDETIRLVRERIKKNNIIIRSNVLIATIALIISLYIFIGIYYSTLKSVSQLALGSKSISQGNLDFQVNLESEDELQIAGKSYNLMRDNLKKLVTNIKIASKKMQQSSDEIAKGNADLAKRTILQTSSLAETSTSMDNIAKTVQKNADNAKNAFLNAESAKKIAQEGSRVTKEMAIMMEMLTASTAQITDIIEVIDFLAFQTNILALNAAVEAARAGEEGRGFAVVAGEIQNLSKRSEESAHGIKELIQDSVSHIKECSKLTKRVLDSIEKITGSFTEVSTMVSDINNASIEVNADIQQINSAINEIGKVNKKNNLLVDAVNQAAKSLQEDANQMMTEVNVFKVNSGTEGKQIPLK